MRKIVAIAIVAILATTILGISVAQAQDGRPNIAPNWQTTTMSLTIERFNWGGDPLGEPSVFEEPRLYKKVGDALFWVTPGAPWPLLTFELVGENTWECRALIFEAVNRMGDVAKYVQVVPLTITFSNDEIRVTGEADVYVLRETNPESGGYNWVGVMHHNYEGSAPLGTPAKP